MRRSGLFAFTLTVAVVMSPGTVTSADAQTGGVREVSATERGVIPILESDGYSVIAVQNPLTSLADDVATTKRVIDAQKGPVVAVGHSYGGAVITAAAAGSSKVKALVYVAAFAPEAERGARSAR